MNEIHSGKKNLAVILGLVVLIAVLGASVCLIFAGLEAMASHSSAGTELPTDSYEVLNVETGQVSDYRLNITGAAETGQEKVEEWMERCLERQPEGKVHWLMYTDPDSWDAFVYLPGLTEKISNQNVSISVSEEDNTLTVYLSTMGLEEGAQPEEQLLHFSAPARGAWPSRVKVIQNGGELPQGTACIYNGGWFWGEGMDD